MLSTIQEELGAIAGLCRKYEVALLHVFGSATRDDSRPGKSDLDLLVDFSAMGGHAKAHAYFALLDELEELLGVRVDLVMVNAVKNRYIARDIRRTKQMLHAA